MLSKSVQELDLGHTKISLRADNVIQVDGTDFYYSLKEVKEIHNAIEELVGNKRVPYLINAHNFTSVDAETREYLSTEAASRNASVKAYVIRSLSQRILLNFIISFKGTEVKARFFTDLDAANKWLLKVNKK